MSQQQHPSAREADEQRRRIRRNAIVLGLLALGIYVAFIASGVMGVRG